MTDKITSTIMDPNPSNVTDNGRYETDTAQTALDILNALVLNNGQLFGEAFPEALDTLTRALQQPAPPDAEVKAAFDFIWEELADFIKECDVPDSYVLKVERSLKTIRAAALQRSTKDD